MAVRPTMRVLVVFGTRPEAIKMAPVIQGLRRAESTEVTVCVTAQHREMLDQVLEVFAIKPDIDLDLMEQNQTPARVAGRVLLALDGVLADLRPDWVLVQGDTTTVMAAAIAAHYNRTKVAHVEAGLRSYDRANPFPEEMNRVVAGHVSDVHFAPTAGSRDNLIREGIASHNIFVTGNTVIDALRQIATQPAPPAVCDLLARLHVSGNGARPILVTAHRRENFGAPLQGICRALRVLAARGDVHVIYPVHPNPQVAGTVRQLLEGVPGVTLLPPLDYVSLIHLMKSSCLVLTDSGGVQEEAPSLGVPVLVLRQATERPEGVAAGTARLVGADPDTVVAEATRLLDDAAAYQAMARASNPYGDGQAAHRIVDVLLTGNCHEFTA